MNYDGATNRAKTIASSGNHWQRANVRFSKALECVENYVVYLFSTTSCAIDFMQHVCGVIEVSRH